MMVTPNTRHNDDIDTVTTSKRKQVMTSVHISPPKTIAVSISESPDMAVLGLSNEHFQEAFGEIALYLLANGANLAYGGDLRRQGFTTLLFELCERYRRNTNTKSIATVTNYLAWPVHITMSFAELDKIASCLHGFARMDLVDLGGSKISFENRQRMTSRQPSDQEWSAGLTAMRKLVCSETDAHVVLGGRIEDYKGKMPGIAEEVLVSFELNHPVFLIGGFGGCAGDIAETLGLIDAWTGDRPDWPGRHVFERYGPGNLQNGLSLEENKLLARSPYISQAVTLILRGLHRLRETNTYNQANSD
ncbi:MAG: hypothetical protein OXL96_00485 [Candidatus Poribacteria bacterium]|nr:hypothetical protein [Candidatus Poribacteria bacterium]